MDENTPRYWFRAKRYGWGWGPPATWQGWGRAPRLDWDLTAVSSVLAPYSLPLFFVFVAVMVTALVAVCYAKGEPPHWRWGND